MNFKVCVYNDKNNNQIALFCLKKIHQMPINFGVASCAISVRNIELEKIGLKLFKEIKYNGIGSAEFKYDERDKKYKLIEINSRYWQQNYLSLICGINFPLIDYAYSTGIKVLNPSLNLKLE